MVEVYTYRCTCCSFLRTILSKRYMFVCFVCCLILYFAWFQFISIPNLHREQRNNFIRTKYETRRYAIRTCADSDELKEELLSAVQTHDIYGLLQVYAEGLDLLSSLPGDVCIAMVYFNGRRLGLFSSWPFNQLLVKKSGLLNSNLSWNFGSVWFKIF